MIVILTNARACFNYFLNFYNYGHKLLHGNHPIQLSPHTPVLKNNPLQTRQPTFKLKMSGIIALHQDS